LSDSTIEMLKDVYYVVRIGLMQAIGVIIIFWLIPNKNLLTLILTILSFAYIGKIANKDFKIKGWIITTLITIVLVCLFFFSYQWLGQYGIMGSIIIILTLVAFRIGSNWKLYNSVTTWGAERINGKHNEPFNLKEVMEDGSKRGRTGEDEIFQNTMSEVPEPSSFKDNEARENRGGNILQELPVESSEPKKRVRKVKKDFGGMIKND